VLSDYRRITRQQPAISHTTGSRDFIWEMRLILQHSSPNWRMFCATKTQRFVEQNNSCFRYCIINIKKCMGDNAGIKIMIDNVAEIVTT
jgi:hypothetical protein